MNLRTVALHVGLLALTFVTGTLAGVQWLNKDPFELSNFTLGLTYAVLIILFLTAHEMGHYAAARFHGVDTTLPFFLPFPPFLGLVPFGTLGAVIRIRSEIRNRNVLLDIGAAGPICGFIVCMGVLGWGMTHLPPIDYLYSIHPEYRNLSQIPQSGLTFGKPLIFTIMEFWVLPPSSFMPPMNEIYHYPFLCVGWFGTFVTALNLLPVGQLDGGHIGYAMFGSSSNRLTQIVLVTLTILGTAGILPIFGIDFKYGWTGWLMWSIVLAILLRTKRFKHPALPEDQILGPRRATVGWFCGLILALCFTPNPVSI